jgi:hypothetical protein
MSVHTIICPTCKNEISIDDVLTRQIETELKEHYEAKHQQEIEQVKKSIGEAARKAAIDQVRQEYLSKIESTKEESLEREKQNKELQEQVKLLLKQLREERDSTDKLAIEYEKKLLDEQAMIKQRAKAEAMSELELRLAEKDKKLTDAIKANEDLRRKLEQGSQQLQGEVQEIHLQEMLLKEFPYDEIREVPKGIGGADVIQTVRTSHGGMCGTLIWESKNTKSWSHGWIQKLKDDQRALKADVAVLVSKIVPEGCGSIGMVDGVIVCEVEHALPVALLLRQQLMKVQAAFTANQDKASKAEVVYNYLISNDFKQRIEVWVEYFSQRREEVDKERAYFMKKWEREDKKLVTLLANTAGIYGDLQGLIGNALPKINRLEIPDVL